MILVFLYLLGVTPINNKILNEEQTDEVQQCTFSQASGNYADENFISTYRIPNSAISYTSSGDHSPVDDRTFEISHAFDDNLDTYWVADRESTDDYSSHIIISYKSPITVEAFLYDGNYFTHDPHRDFYGFPLEMTVYTSTGGSEFKKVAFFKSNRKPGKPWIRIQFPLNKPITGDKIKLEFNKCTENYYFTPNNNTNALIANLILIQGITDEYSELLSEITNQFTDYCQLELNDTYTKEKASELRNRALKFNTFNLYDDFLKPLLDRADDVLVGTIRKDPYFEFSTKKGAMNKILQYGDMSGYCKNTLKFSWYGTNLQSTGVGGTTGRKLTIYVDVEPFEGYSKSDVKLPKIGYSQSYGTWNYGMNDGPINLGRNERVFNDFLKHGGITYEVAGGGAMYIINPYTPETQKGHVTIYFDNCYRFPVYHIGDDEEAFKVILKDYYNRLQDQNDDEITIDVFEIATNYVLNSGLATAAYDTYITQGKSVKENAENWDILLHELLRFGGVQFDEDEPLYNEMNNHIWENIRVVQPYAGMYAFATSQMIGLPSPDTHHNLYYVNKPGWAVSHEFGHTVDKQGRAWAENTNNMWAIYNVYHINEEVTERNSMSLVSERLSPDTSDYVTHKDGLGLMDGDYVVWWFIEASHPGYWGKFENLFITETSDKNENGQTILGVAERTIYYSCLAIGENLCSYFDRFGYYYAGDPVFTQTNRFTYEKSSENFKNLLNQAITNNRIKNTFKKAWYINLDFFKYLNKHDWKLGDWAHCYSEKDIIEPVSFDRTNANDGYIIHLPNFKNNEAHLCYEIQSLINNEWKVIGITYTTAYTDTYNYGSNTPQYKVYGYDRNFDHTGDPGKGTIPVVKPIEPVVRVCRIGDVYYDTITEAISAAKAEDTILLCKSFLLSDNININKAITIMPDENLEGPIVITKTRAGNLIGISSNNVKIGSKDRVKIILDGGSFQQDGAVLRTGSQQVSVENTILRNNYNTNEGGGIFLGQNGKVSLLNCIIENCRASGGGGINTRGGGVGSTHIILEDVIIRNNTATNNGGGICNSGTNGHSSIISSKGLVVENNTANNGGGIYVVMKTDLTNAIIRKNTARSHGAGVYVDCDSNEEQRYFRVNNLLIENNKDQDGDTAVYVGQGQFIINGGTFHDRIQLTNTGSMKLVNWSDELGPTIPNFADATFIVQLSNEGTILFSEVSEGFKLENPLNGFNVLNGYCTFENNLIKAYIGKSYFSIIASDGKKYNIEYPYGNFVFPLTFEGLSEDYYILEWTSSNGQKYNIGDEIYLGQNYSFSISVHKYCMLKFVSIDKEEIVKVKYGTNYYMPASTPDGKRVFGWDCSDGNYYAYAQNVFITSDLIFTPAIKGTLTLTVRICENANVYAVNQGYTYTLPTVPDQYNGDSFKYWLVNGEKLRIGDTITVTTTTTAIAFYSVTFIATYVKGNTEETVEYIKDKSITLNYPGPNNEEQFIYWEIDNRKYYPYSNYTIRGNVRIVAHYASIDKTKKIKVTYVVPHVSDQPPHLVEGTKNKIFEFSYLDNITLLDENYFANEPNGLGYDKATGKKVVFDHWEINSMKFEGSAILGITEPIRIVLITSYDNNDVIPITPDSDNYPFKTPEPMEIQELEINNGIIESNDLGIDNNIEYVAKISSKKVEIHGNGHKNLYLSINKKNVAIDIKQTEAEFGIKLDSSSKEPKILLNQENVNMNIKGDGTLTIQAADNVKSLSLRDATVSNNENLNLKSDQKLSSIKLDNLKMYGNSAFNSLDEQKPVTIDTITVHEGANTKMVNIKASNKVIIELNAAVSLSKVDLSQVKQMMISFQQSSSSKAPITGKLDDPPAEISLIQENSNKAISLDDEKSFTIASSNQEDFAKCEDWINKVKTENTPFNKVECRNNDNQKELVAFHSKDKGKNSNKTAIIIGVVVAVVVVIIIVVVVVIIVRKKKKYVNTSDADNFPTNKSNNNDGDFDI